MHASPSKNKVCVQQRTPQIEFYHLPSLRSAHFRKDSKNVQREARCLNKYLFRRIFQLKTDVNGHDIAKRIRQTIDDFWQYIPFTDEARINPSSMAQVHIPWECGTRYNARNSVTRRQNRLYYILLRGVIGRKELKHQSPIMMRMTAYNVLKGLGSL